MITVNRIIIQEEISITQKDVEKTIRYYESMPKEMAMGLLGKCFHRDDIIKEIKKLSKVGKEILLMNYRYKKYIRKLKK